MNPASPPPDDEARPARISRWSVVLGGLVGAVGWIAVYIVTSNLFFGVDVDYRVAETLTVLGWAGVAAAMIAVPRTRQAGSGFLLGVAISFLIWAGVCAATRVTGGEW